MGYCDCMLYINWKVYVGDRNCQSRLCVHLITQCKRTAFLVPIIDAFCERITYKEIDVEVY
jgi:hypothetical protein